MGIKHIYTQTVADGTATSVVRPSDWNSVHAYTLQDAVSLAGNTAGVLANISSGTLILAGGNNITLSQAGNNVTVAGPSLTPYLTTAALSQDSSKYAGTNGAMTGGSVTVNTAGVSINLPAYLTTAMLSNAATLSNLKVSAGASSALRSDLTFSNANGVSFGLDTDGVITGTVRTNYQSSGAYLTTAALSQDSSKYAGTNGAITGGSITVNTAGVSVNLPAYLTTARASTDAIGLNTAQSNVTWTVNSSGLSLDARGYAGSGFTSGGNNIGLSATQNSAGLSLSATVAAQTVQSAIRAFGVSNTGQTAGNTGVSTGIDWVLAGSNAITLSQATTTGGPNTIWVQHPAWLTTAALSQDSSKYAGTNGAITGGSITVNTSGVSINLPAYLTTADLSANSSKYVQAWELTGNTAGTTSSAQGTKLYFQGGNSITVSGSNNTIVFSVGNYLTTAALSQDSSKYAATGFTSAGANVGISGTQNTAGLSLSITVPAAVAQSNQTVGLYASSNTYLTSSGTIDARSLSFRGDKSITVGISAGEVLFSVGAYITTAMASNRASDFVQATAVFNGTNATGTIASGALSVSVAAPIPIGTAVKAVGSIGSTGTITRYAPEDHQHAGVAAFAVTNTGNTLGNTRSQVGTFYLAASGAITASQSTGAAGNDTVWFSVASQTNQTIGGYAVGNTTGQSSSSTFDARTLSFNGAGNVSVGYSAGSIVISGGSAAAAPINFSAGTTSSDIGSVVFSNSNGISFGLSGSTITANANTVGTATTGYVVASANSVGTVTRWAAEDHRHAGIGALGISTSGNTAGTTGSVQGTYWIQGGNSITVSQITSNNGSHTLVISAGNYLTTARASTDAIGLNTAQTNVTWTVNSSGLSLNAGGYAGTNSAITGGSMTVNTSGVSVNIPLGTLAMWPVVLPGSTAVSTYYSGSTSQGAGGGSTQTGYTFSLYAVPLPMPGAVAFSELRVGVSNQSVVGTGSATHMFSAGIYSNNASTLSLVKGFYGGIVLSQNSQTAQTFSVFTATTAGVTSGAGGGMAGINKGSVYSSQGNISANSQIFGRMQFIRIDSGVATTLTGGQYYLVFGNATASSGANVLSNVGILQSNAISSQHIPDIGRENSTQTSNYLPAWGAISTTFTSVSNAANFFALPNAIAITNMTLSDSSAQRFHFAVMRNHS